MLLQMMRALLALLLFALPVAGRADISNPGSTTNASALTSGTLAAARGGAGTISGAMKGNGSGTVSQAACADLSDATANCSAAAGQLPGIATNTAASTGNVGEVLSEFNANNNATVTITIASPGIVSWSGNGLTVGAAVNFTTTGALPTGITAGTTYYVSSANFVAGTSFAIATTVSNAAAGTSLNTSGSQSGTQTGIASAILSNGSAADVGFLTVTAGDYDCWGQVEYDPAASTSITKLQASINTTPTTIANISGSAATVSSAAYVPGASAVDVLAPQTQILASGTTTVYLVGKASFTVSTMNANGALKCRRRR